MAQFLILDIVVCLIIEYCDLGFSNQVIQGQ